MSVVTLEANRVSFVWRNFTNGVKYVRHTGRGRDWKSVKKKRREKKRKKRKKEKEKKDVERARRNYE